MRTNTFNPDYVDAKAILTQKVFDIISVDCSNWSIKQHPLLGVKFRLKFFFCVKIQV